MAGRALKNLETPTRRYSREEFETVSVELQEIILKTFKRAEIPLYYKNKERFGDIDIFVSMEAYTGVVKTYIEENLSKELNLMRVESPLIVDKSRGMNDYLDRDGSRTPIDFQCGLGLDKKIDAQVVQAVTKWKRFALQQFDLDVGEGLYTDMRAVR